ncbi:MAG: HNH endonuclease [Anaerolineae bacterium]|nr:HNH endonuclease [Anaerolineae bacterium]
MTHIPAHLRHLVVERSNNCCEYCRVGQSERVIDFAIDHIIAEKHGGPTNADNLCLSCYWCNSHKGSDISSVDWSGTGEVVPLFDPRRHTWSEHFQLDGAVIRPLTANGRVTASLLRFNDPQRIMEREMLLLLGEYPCPSS